MTQPIANLAAALAKVQAELPKLDRDRTVTVEPKDPKKDIYTYSYVTLAKLSEAILPLLSRHGLAFAAMPCTGTDGKMCVRYYLLHDSGEVLFGEFPISGEGGIQMIGGRITYARRYCLAALIGVAADEDDESRLADEGAPRTAQRAAQRPRAAAIRGDTTTVQRAAQRPRGGPPLPGEDQDPDGPVGADQHRRMRGLWADLGYGADEHRLTRLGITANILGLPELNSSADLTREQADRVIAALIERKQQTDRDGSGS